MPPRQGSKRKAPRKIGDLHDPEGFGVWVRRHLEWMAVHNYSPRSVGNTESSLALFVEWCEARSLMRPVELTKPILERYQHHLHLLRRPDGRPRLSFRSQRVRLSAVRGFFKWLVKQNVLTSNPASELEMPRLPLRIPRDVLTVDDVERVMEQPDTRAALGVRDRAILEVFYSTGVRRSELVKIGLADVDEERSTLMVREGKGRKDRMLPIGERALSWVVRYVRDVRPSLVMPPDPGVLFLTTLGEPLTPDWLTQQVRRYVQAAELGKGGACHVFRHAMATHMLEGGADIRYIQEMLGHVLLTSTEVYTQVSIKKLQAIHAATHPGAKLAKCGEMHDEGGAGDGHALRTGTAKELLSRLHDEAHDEDDA
jgi:integrase/recombinase XerD